MKKIEDLTKEDISKLHYGKGHKSITEIARMYNCSEKIIREKLGISGGTYEPDILEKAEMLKDLKSLEPIEYIFKDRDNIYLPLPIKVFRKNKAGNARVTLVLSDLHLGDTDHLPETFWSTIHNLKLIMKVLTKRFKIPHIDIIVNGDLVCGKGVFRYQEYRTLAPRGHWQTALAEIILREVIEDVENVLPVRDMIVLKGTHEEQGENYAMYIKRSIDRAKYGGHYVVYNVGQDIGNCNVLITHGYGSSDYYPLSYTFIRDLWESITKYARKGVPIERVCVSHYHWLFPNLPLKSIIADCTGGFQRWEKTISQRDAGMILYFFYDGEVSVIPVRPDPDVQHKEINDSALEYKNMNYYGQKLLKHLEQVEHVDVVD